ncbi:Glutathione-regulated potassium-efflux system protein KefC [Oleispira antarctica RB-8]|uniref:Glutathione-regulated potassium-efflux system protein KefC n=1 Tax=Oleispira antarctica RB-8 TaxID=698738 RepID=R4YV32_OLEAN|nr:Glutathione-regulated potassium-efflux system protein KefC [Oleispira antarctica RB-8]
MTGYFLQAFIYLAAAVIMVPLAKRLGLGSVLGYLMAGVLIGPVFGLVGSETSTIQHFAEFGVVMMLFLVGMELEPKALWAMRHRLMGLGGLQVGLTTAVITGLAVAFSLPFGVSLTIGFIFALSSTAIVLQTFNEKSLTKTDGARNAFSVLLFQDIAVIPMLAFIPLLAIPELVEQSQVLAGSTGQHDNYSLVAHLPRWAYGLAVIAAIAFVVVGGHFLSRPLFRYIAASGLREMFTTTALLLVIGIAALMSLVGLSPALGTFLAGVVLANSEFRHELESNIEPFKGLLLGLFFITVGAGINFAILSDNALIIAAITLGLMSIKALVLYGLARVFNISGSDRWLFALSLAQAGEFGFVLLSFAQQQHVLPTELVQLLSLPVALSMFLTPGLFILFEKTILPRFSKTENKQHADKIDEQGSVIIAGSGRFGQVVNRLLVSNHIKTTVLDYQASRIELMRSINIKSYFGDATQPNLLHTAGISDAQLLVVAIDQPERAKALVRHVKMTYPQVKILARAFDRGQSYELEKAGADYVISETFYSALEMGKQALIDMGMSSLQAQQQRHVFLATEAKHKGNLYEAWLKSNEDEGHINHVRELFMNLEAALQEEMDKERSDS